MLTQPSENNNTHKGYSLMPINIVNIIALIFPTSYCLGISWSCFLMFLTIYATCERCDIAILGKLYHNKLFSPFGLPYFTDNKLIDNFWFGELISELLVQLAFYQFTEVTFAFGFITFHS